MTTSSFLCSLFTDVSVGIGIENMSAGKPEQGRGVQKFVVNVFGNSEIFINTSILKGDF